MGWDIRRIMEGMTKTDASDLHVKVGSPPMLRIHGRLRPVDMPPLTSDDTAAAVDALLPERLRADFNAVGTVDFSISLPGVSRFRINAFHQRGSESLAVRRLSHDVPTVEELNLPPIVAEIARRRRGLVLVTGVTGSGKSSTLAAMIRTINETRREHIITIEDPIEFLYRDKKSIVNQLELGVDTRDFATALKHVLRQDPDVILIGEIRDRETVKTALTAVETGHLVFSTLHTPDAKQTLNRILHFFPKDDERLILQQLGLSLGAIVSQRLIPASDGKGRLPCVEILVNNPMASKLINEGRIEELGQLMRNQEDGMQVFDISLAQQVRDKRITLEDALGYCEDQAALKRLVKGGASSGDRRGLIGGPLT